MRSVLEALRRWGGTELPCGCIAPDGRGARFSEYTTVTDRESKTLWEKQYQNCTREKYEWEVTVQCDQCGATWTETSSGGSRVDYGDENPGAHQKLESEMRGRRVVHKEVPVVEPAE